MRDVKLDCTFCNCMLGHDNRYSVIGCILVVEMGASPRSQPCFIWTSFSCSFSWNSFKLQPSLGIFFLSFLEHNKNIFVLWRHSNVKRCCPIKYKTTVTKCALDMASLSHWEIGTSNIQNNGSKICWNLQRIIPWERAWKLVHIQPSCEVEGQRIYVE